MALASPPRFDPPPTILLIEDDQALAHLLEVGLGYCGFRVQVAHTGSDGLDRALANPPDLVVLDWMLPGLDGMQVCRRLRQHSRVPIIMLTARVTRPLPPPASPSRRRLIPDI